MPRRRYYDQGEKGDLEHVTLFLLSSASLPLLLLAPAWLET